MQDEAEVRLVETHAEGRRRNERLDLVVPQCLLEPDPLGRLGPAGVGGHVVAGVAQGGGDVLGGRHGQRVDDAGARQVAEVRDEPGEPLLGGGERQHTEAQRRSGERASQREDLPAARAVVTSPARRQLLDDVGHDARIRRRRCREDRRLARQRGEQVPDPPVVGPEVVTPVADAVRLVDDEQAARRREGRELLIAKARVVQALRADEQHVHLTARQRSRDRTPLVGVRRVERDCADPGPLGCGDLVPHQRQERADDDGRPGTLRSS